MMENINMKMKKKIQTIYRNASNRVNDSESEIDDSEKNSMNEPMIKVDDVD